MSEEKLRLKLERVLIDVGGQILIPMSDKNMIMECLITLESMFQSNTKLQAGFRELSKGLPPVFYLDHMSRDTLGVGRSHLGWMNFSEQHQVYKDIDENPLNFQYVKEVFSLEEYHQLVNSVGESEGPRVLVTSMASFE